MRESQSVCIDNWQLIFEIWLSLLSIVAVGAEEPLAEHMMVADFFRK
jgi:hypothetical protein